MPRKYNLQLIEKPNHITYYLLGAFIADGCVNNNYCMRLSSKDKKWLKIIAPFISNKASVAKVSNSNCFVLNVYNTEIIKWFIANECVPRKSSIVKLPIIPEIFFSHFMRGLFDGDGCITIIKEKSGITSTLRVYIAGGNIDFFNSIKNKLSSLNINSNIIVINNANKSICGRLPKNYKDSYRLTINGKNAIKFCEFIYNNDQLYLSRKKAIFKKYLKIHIKNNKKCTRREPFNNILEVLELLKKYSYAQVSKIYNVSDTTIRNRLKRAGVYDEAKKNYLQYQT